MTFKGMRFLGLLALLTFGVSLCSAEEKLYYLAVDTASQQPVEDALRDLQKRYGIKFGALASGGTAVPTAVPPAVSGAPLNFKIDRKTRASGRIPKTEQEFKDLTAAGRESPAACYAWIYGKDSPPAQQLQGHTWSELGEDDGIQQCRAEASRVQQAQSLMGF